jgi:transcriptional regulator with XRE-family HTH domain
MSSIPAAASSAPNLFDVIDRAARRAGISLKELALCIGISPAQLSRELHGTGHLGLDRLWAAPPAFRAALVDELCAAWGYEPALTARDVLALIGPVMAHIATQEGTTCARF